MSNGNLEIKADLRPSPAPYRRAARRCRRDDEVCKLIDMTTCIGCKACEVACVEWNDMPFRETTFDNTYQTMPATAWNYWNLIKFNEYERDDGTLQLADAQGPVHALRGSRVPARLPRRRRHRPVHQRHRRLPAGELHRLPVLRLGLPVQHPEVQPATKKVYKCTLCSDRVGRAWSRRASRPVRPAACTSAPRTTC